MAPFSNCTIKKQSDSSAIWAGAGPRPEQDLKHQRMHTHDEPSQILSLFLLSLSERGTLQQQGHAGERARVPAQVQPLQQIHQLRSGHQGGDLLAVAGLAAPVVREVIHRPTQLAPSQPTGLSGRRSAAGMVALSWDAVSGATWELRVSALNGGSESLASPALTVANP